MASSVENRFAIEASEDRMKACIKCTRRGGYSSLTPGEIVAALEAARIEIGDQVANRIQEFVRLVTDQGLAISPFEIATAQPPVEGSDAQFVWDPRFEKYRVQPWNVQDRATFYGLESFVTVKAMR